MIALDTNVLVRHLVGDDLVQAKRSSRLIADAEERGEECYISTIVLAELTWVLASAYDVPRNEIVETLEKLARVKNFVFEDAALIHGAIEHFKKGRGGFSDYLIVALADRAGCEVTYTFDKPLLKESGFRAP